MKRPGIVFVAIFTLFVGCWTIRLAADETSGDTADMKHDDGTAEGRLVIGDAGEAVHFTLPKEGEKIAGVRVHGSRYGAAEAPKEKLVVYILNADSSEILRTEMAPYSLFEVGPEKWVDINFAHPIEVPKDFWVLFDSHANKARGIYISYDKSTEGKYSRMGLPWLDFQNVPFGGDWMIELIPAK